VALTRDEINELCIKQLCRQWKESNLNHEHPASSAFWIITSVAYVTIYQLFPLFIPGLCLFIQLTANQLLPTLIRPLCWIIAQD
jgi:hypothetical protein